LDDGVETGFTAELFDGRVETLQEDLVRVFAQGQAGGHGMAAKLQDNAGVALRNEIQHVAQVDVWNRSARAAQFAAVRAREGEGRAPISFFQPRGNQADDALMPIRVVYTYGGAYRGLRSFD